ncbi:DUF1641 domain-containing protein [Domibacillus iocasae]|uniref:DUF1641 domain-containing protein n=1 Tax=Domibacillus iocasae TaxID=1714016 RepID=A0A1E7DP28_9BACI|nr:DUF1641 domain-containing protein [Domibacillus iocasae]OES44814.1 hypothetical protein BA724_05950 [Domibacillus iocasae]
MAKAITTIHRLEINEEEQRRRDLEEIETLLVEHKDTLKEFLHMLGEINKKGGLEMGASLFSEGDRVLDVLVKAIDKPEAASILKNGLLMLGTLGKLNVSEMGPLVNKLNSVISVATKISRVESSAVQLVKGNTMSKSWLVAAAGASLAGMAYMARKSDR